ncbi:hypothetical protein SAMN04487864_101397 [Succiniclasticum ruminis]|uniref:Glycosyltransferase RgtA/B/C/D-like domain-containing protein n=1 Tax=Succiniclasticum ruminis TaxID=40841 RepID=A0A1G6I362_9FIRM|nr:DUF6056 family protein [Succiniclasticum ruminis]SDC00515.1 hypothetical protein SAMN04487864_101397 [Succiniclasticum ruminis]
MIEKQNKNKNGLFALIVIYSFLFILNYLTPMGFGDDYLYSFIWQGNAMNHPLSLDAVRISSFSDLFLSQWRHYFTWGGRTVAHSLAQFFLWQGKVFFNLINSFVGALLVVEVYWCIHKGKVSFSFNPKILYWIFFALWAFTPGFTPVFLWLTGACNYLWTCVILIGLMIPYIKKYYYPENKNCDCTVFAGFMFLCGVIAGWTNENSVCWIILTLAIHLLVLHRKSGNIENWMYTGFIGLIVGYIALMFAPGNLFRLHLIHGLKWDILQTFTINGSAFLKVIFCQFLLWYFLLRFFYIVAHVSNMDADLRKESSLITILSIISLGMTGIMLMAPDFPERSGFFGTVWLIIAIGIASRIQKEHKMKLIQDDAKRFLSVIGVIYFIMTSVITIQYFYEMFEWHRELIHRVVQSKNNNKKTVLIVKPFRKANKTEVLMSGFHIIENGLSEDADNWENVAFARYYGIKEIQEEKD